MGRAHVSVRLEDTDPHSGRTGRVKGFKAAASLTVGERRDLRDLLQFTWVSGARHMLDGGRDLRSRRRCCPKF